MATSDGVKREIIRRLSYKGPEENGNSNSTQGAQQPQPAQQPQASKPEADDRGEAPASVIKREVVRRLSYKGPEEAPPSPKVVNEADLPGFNTAETFRYETGLLIFMIGAIIVLFATTTEEGLLVTNSDTGVNDFNSYYQMYIGIEIMMFFGFGYLMCFLKRYGMGAVGFTMLITVLGILWGILVEGFFNQACRGHFEYIKVDILTLMDSLFLVATILITYGGIIGKVSPLQLVFITILETIFYSINKRCLLLQVVEFVDAGGSINIHMFGAYFGLSIAWIIGKPGAGTESEGGHVADLFSLIGTVFLWIYWPSFNGGSLEANSAAQQRAIINTILGMCASTIGAFIVSSTFSYSKKIRPVDIQNATLSAGVALGAVCHVTMRLSDPLLIGLAAGSLTTYGYLRIQFWLEKNLHIHDTCGIHNLHAMPSVLGGVASIVLAGWKGSKDVEVELYDDQQWKDQWVACVFTLAMAISTGLLTGFFVYFLRPKENTEFFTDAPYWEIMDDFGRSFEEVLADLAKYAEAESSEAKADKKDVELAKKA